MGLRTIVVCIIGVLIIKLAGRRTFSMNMALDNLITIMMGGILTRGIDGRTPFLGVVASAIAVVVFYRAINWGCVYSNKFGRLIKGREKIIYQNGSWNTDIMKKFMVTEKDIQERVRVKLNKDSFDDINQIYIERGGDVSIVQKEEK